MQEVRSIQTHKLVAVLKNGMIVFSQLERDVLSIFCQNPFSDCVYPIEQGVQITDANISYVGALLSSDERTVSVLMSYTEKYTLDLEDNCIHYRADISDGKVIMPVRKEVIADFGQYIPVDTAISGGLFHTNHTSRFTGALLDLTSRVTKKIDYSGHTYQNISLHSTLFDGFFCLAMYGSNGSLFNIGSGGCYLKLFDANQKNIKPIFSIQIKYVVNAIALSPDGSLLAISKTPQSQSWCDYRENRFVSEVEVWSVRNNKKLYVRDFHKEIDFHNQIKPGDLKDSRYCTVSMAVSNKGDLAVALRYEGVNHLYFYAGKTKQPQHINMTGMDYEEFRSVNEENLAMAGYFSNDACCFIFPSTAQSWHMCQKNPETGRWSIVKRQHFGAGMQPEYMLGQRSQTKAPSAPIMGTQTLQRLELANAASLPPIMGAQTRQRLELGNDAPSAPPVSAQTLARLEGRSTVPSSSIEQVMLNFQRIQGLLGEINQKLDCVNEGILKKPLPIVNIKDMQFVRSLGGGGMGVVDLYRWQQKELAVKRLHKVNGDGEGDLYAMTLRKECEILERLWHENVVRIEARSVSDNGEIFLVMKYYVGGALSQYLYSPESWNNPLAWRLRCAQEVAQGLAYLHRKNMLHLDIKPENVFLQADWHAVIGDFGISRLLKTNKTHYTTSSMSGTPSFMAPEIITPPAEGQQTQYAKPNDIYSFGMLLFCCLTEKIPFQGLNPMQIMYAVAVSQQRQVIPADVPPKLAGLVNHCWKHDPSDRPNADEVSAKITSSFNEENRGRGGHLFPTRK